MVDRKLLSNIHFFNESVYQTGVHLFPSLNTAGGNQRKAFGRLGGAVEAQHFNFKIETKGNRASEEGEDEKSNNYFGKV